jgi:hypothetical protein
MGEPDGERFSRGGATLFGCGAAMAIPRTLFRDCGGFDPDFFAYYEDVDLGWRLRILGHRIVVVPDARVYHHHSATSFHIDLHRLRVLHYRNPLLMILKNYDDENLRRVLPAALLVSSRRTWYLSSVDPGPYRIGSEVRGGGADRSWFRRKGRSRAEYEEATEVPKLVVSDLIAVNDVVDKFPGILEKRSWIQNRRKCPDAEILPLFRDPFRCAEENPDYVRFQERVCRLFGVYEMFGGETAGG